MVRPAGLRGPNIDSGGPNTDKVGYDALLPLYERPTHEAED